MSEIEADLDKAASAYWMSVAAKAGPGHSLALSNANNLARDSRAEARIPDSARQPTLNTLEAPPLDVLKSKPLTL
jgi:hypothetical protein